MVVVLAITLSIFIGILFSSSYAWYAYANAETAINGETIKEVPTVIFSQTEYVYSKTTLPIRDEDHYNYASKNSFSITVGEKLKNYDVGVEILLNDIIMSNELKIANYKYELLQDNEVVSSGNFSNIGSNNKLDIAPMILLTPSSYPKTYSYELYIWLSDDGTNQNDLMNKAFSAKVNVKSAIKK